MIFTSLLFLAFITVVFFSYWLLPHRFRWILLLAASLFFYGVNIPEYIAVLTSSVLLNYCIGIWICRLKSENSRKRVLATGVILNVLFLALFKYSYIFLSFLPHTFSSGNYMMADNGKVAGLILPLGISFFTFTNISYLIEIKRRHIVAERHLGYFANYITFFPKLIQGPIERPQAFLPQFKKEHLFNYHQIIEGMRLMLWGFFKKLVIADRLSLAVDNIYSKPSSFSGPAIIIATVFYSIQIYADFSGYIDIARGVGKILGFEISKNFNLPYAAKSIKDFWARWHITLSNWLRDYVFLPLAFSISRRLKKERYLSIRTDHLIYAFAITVTFLLCGIWHGVGYTFLAWGALYAIYLVVGRLTEKPKRRFYKKTGLSMHSRFFKGFQLLVTFSLVTFAWMVFRADSFTDFLQLLTNCFHGWKNIDLIVESLLTIFTPGFSQWELYLALLFTPIMFIVEYIHSNTRLWGLFIHSHIAVRWTSYYLIIMIILCFGKFNLADFVYFKF